MTNLTIYHNPRCSKSRQALELLKSQGLEPTVVEYIKEPLNYEQLTALRDHIALKDLVRTNEKCFKELALSLDDEAGILNAMIHEPKLMQRPIVVYNNKAAIGRPPENVLELFA
ncbi:MAG: arsenate reductase (glutaredoxin) [Legionellaceae bacterium]|nr:arsenate reductase (glutaredoxin) [Legionellaceae bacterium]